MNKAGKWENIKELWNKISLRENSEEARKKLTYEIIKENAKQILPTDSSELTVRKHGSINKWVAVYKSSGESNIKYSLSDSPLGGWSEPKTIYKIPELDPLNKQKYHKKNYCYAVKEQSYFRRAGKIVISYVCQNWELEILLKNLNLYKPVVKEFEFPISY